LRTKKKQEIFERVITTHTQVFSFVYFRVGTISREQQVLEYHSGSTEARKIESSIQ
jgi:hypothetical protein